MSVEIFENEYPKITDLLLHGGVPGVSYAMVLGENMVDYQDEGWSMLHRVPSFKVIGPKGEVGMILMGKGEPIPGGDPQSGRCNVFIDSDADAITGLTPADPDSKPLDPGTLQLSLAGQPISE